MTPLPPLNSLRAFEVAGRLLSFSNAASELRVTPSAVSRQIMLLERTLGVELFRRSNRTLTLTVEGKQYLQTVQRGFQIFQQGTDELVKSTAALTLRVSVLPSFASNWLVPRLPRFLEQNAGYDVVLETSVSFADFSNDSVDAAVRFGSGPWSGLSSFRLFDLEAFPVCSPALLEEQPLAAPGDLSEHALIHITFMPDLWRFWLTAAHTPEVQSKRNFTFDNAELALQAAENGMGVALGVLPLCSERLRQGRLVAPFSARLSMEESYHLVHRTRDSDLPKIARFRSWLMNTAAAERDTLPRV